MGYEESVRWADEAIELARRTGHSRLIPIGDLIDVVEHLKGELWKAIQEKDLFIKKLIEIGYYDQSKETSSKSLPRAIILDD